MRDPVDDGIMVRPWGSYTILSDTPKSRTKELTIKPGGCLSYQKHNNRSEFWIITQGSLDLIVDDALVTLGEGSMVVIKKESWHTAYVPFGEGRGKAKVTEVWFSENGVLSEEDIERKPLPENCPMQHPGFNGV